jgi:hypothetical protein
MTDASQPRQRGLPFSAGQVMLLLFFGAALWFIAAMLLRYVAPMGAYNDPTRLIMYALIIPGTVPFIWVCNKMARVPGEHFALGCAVILASAMLIDGIVLAWFSWIYSTKVEHVAGSGAVILWGAGVAQSLGLFLNQKSAN